VTTKVDAAGTASPPRVAVVAGRTIWSAALVVFRDELGNAGIWTFVNWPDSLSTTRRCAMSGARACSARRRASAWASRPARATSAAVCRAAAVLHTRSSVARSSGRPCGGDPRGGAGGPPSKQLHASCGHCPALRAARCGSLKPRRRNGCASAEPAANDRPSLHRRNKR
jgi:hypothetical protein